MWKYAYSTYYLAPYSAHHSSLRVYISARTITHTFSNFRMTSFFCSRCAFLHPVSSRVHYPSTGPSQNFSTRSECELIQGSEQLSQEEQQLRAIKGHVLPVTQLCRWNWPIAATVPATLTANRQVGPQYRFPFQISPPLSTANVI